MATEDAVLFKHESETSGVAIGPVYVRRAGQTKAYKESTTVKRFDGSFAPAWFTLTQARRIATLESLPLREE
jgi:hypothetical protein